MRVILGPREKNKDRDIPYNPLLMKPNKAGMSLYNVLCFCPSWVPNTRMYEYGWSSLALSWRSYRIRFQVSGGMALGMGGPAF